jgi:hypothetical protein
MVTPPTAGSKSITAAYQGDSNYAGSTSGAVSHTVNKADTSVTITNASTLSSTATVVGQSIAVNWNVTVDAPGSGTPTGTVTVSGGSGCSASVAAGTCNITGTSFGPITINAAYGGDDNYNGSTSSDVIHTVNRADTSTSITNAGALATPSVVGQPVDVDWSVTVDSPGAGTPTGTVTVSGGGPSCNASVSAGDCDITWTTAGVKSVSATYGANENFNGSTSSSVSHTVNKANTTTTITNPGDLVGANAGNQPHTVKWSVTVNSPGAGTPTGNVSVSVGATVGCTVPVEDGQCNVFGVFPGTWNFTASYAGDANFNGSQSLGVPLSESTTTITNGGALATPTLIGTPFQVNWSVTTPQGTPTGTVNVTQNGAAGCSAAVSAGSCSITPTTAGTLLLVATYSGDSSFRSSSSGAVSHVVEKGSTTITITNGTALSTATRIGQRYDIEWDVEAVSPATGTPTGLVLVTGDFLCFAQASAGKCSMFSLWPGSKSLVATYLGDDSFNRSSSTPVPHQVNFR